MEKRIFNLAAIEQSELNLSTISDLTDEYNRLTGKNLKKFSDKKTAITKLWLILPIEPTTVKPTAKASSTKITMSVVFNLNTDPEIVNSKLTTPQINKIIDIVASNNGYMTKAEIIAELDKQGYKQPGIKIFAWYQKEMIEKGIFTISY